MKAVSLFAGVGGFDLALIQNGAEMVASVEIDKHARKVLQKQFPNTTHLEDVKNVTGQQLFDLGFNSDGIIVGGFPCQDVSVAGKRAGLSDSNGNATRSGLFWQVVRLLEETKAQHFILENVPGLLSSNEGRDFGIVLDALVELGYGVSWRILDAQYFGVPQRRRRIFIVGCLGDDGRTLAKILDLLQSSSGDNRQSNQKRQDFTFSTDESVTPYIKVIRSGARAEDGSLPAEVWAERDVSPTLNVMDNTGEARATVLVFASHRVDDIRLQSNVINTIQAIMGTGGNNMPMVSYPIQDGRDMEKNQNGLGIGDETDPSYTLDRTGGQAVAYSIREDAKANTFSATETNTALAVQALQPSPQSHHAQIFLAEETMVRRLTPMECERLQGFPDGWTEGQADTHRYKQMGNAVAVPVVSWLVNRLMEVSNDTR